MTVTYRCSSCGAVIYTCCEKGLPRTETNEDGKRTTVYPPEFLEPNRVLNELGPNCKLCGHRLQFKEFGFIDPLKGMEVVPT